MAYKNSSGRICTRCFTKKYKFDDRQINNQPNSAWCSDCVNDYKKFLRERWKIQKRCNNCGSLNDRYPMVLCNICAESQNKRTKNYQLRIKIETFNAYGGCFCQCCGESNIVMLAIDHINRDGAQHRKQLRNGKSGAGGGGNKTYYWLKKNGYPSGYRVLCHNCNHAYHVLGECPHKTYGLNIAQKSVLLINSINNNELIQ